MQNKKGGKRTNSRSENIRKDTGGEIQDAPGNQRVGQPLASANNRPSAISSPTRHPIYDMLVYVWTRIGRNFRRRKGRADPRPGLSQVQECTSQELDASDRLQPIQKTSIVPTPPLNSFPDKPSGGFFEGPTDTVNVKGGIINHTLGNYTNVTFNVNSEARGAEYSTSNQSTAPSSRIVSALAHILSPDPLEGDVMPQQNAVASSLLSPAPMEDHNSAQSSTQDISRSQVSSVSTHEQVASTSTTIYSPDNSNTIYERHLEKKKKGFPLWIPEPNRSLPMQYRRRGVNIGDVGIITPSGGFFFLFNICSPHDDPINPRILPEGFFPVHPPIDSMDIREYSEFKPESYLTSTAIERTDNDPPFRGLSFTTSATEGAVLTFPDGAISHDLVNIRRFRAYAAANIESWYRYVNGPRGCEAKNGEVRLVTGCVKATSWGMAAVANMTQHKTHHLKYRSVEDVTAPSAPIPLYKWEHTGFAEARVGPDLHEIEDLKRDDDSDMATGGKYWNQCLFVRTLNITLNDGAFATISQELESALSLESQQYRNRETPSQSTSNSLTPGAETSITSQQLDTDLTTQTQLTSESPGSEVEKLPMGGVTSKHMTMSTSPSAPISHPADVLNKMLLQKVPNCRVVITQDVDWSSVIREDEEVMPSPSQMAERVLAAHHIREEDGMVFLESKPESHYLKELEQYSVHALGFAFGQERPPSIFRNGQDTLYPTSIVSSGASSLGWSPFGSTSTLISHNASTSSRTSSKASSDGYTAFGSASTFSPPKISSVSTPSRSSSLGSSPTLPITRSPPYGFLPSGPSSFGLVPTNPATLSPTGLKFARSPLSGGMEPRIVSNVDRPPEDNNDRHFLADSDFESQLNMSPENEEELELDEIPPLKLTQAQQPYEVSKNTDRE